jgi:hypothetical protein
MSEPITPHALRACRKLARETRAAYLAARRAALALPRSRVGAGLLAREHAISEALTARHDWQQARAALARAEMRPCVKGAIMSPTARERAIRAGRIRD